MTLDGVEVALALHQQPEVAAQDVAAGHARAHRQRLVELRPLPRKPREQLAHQGQTAYGGQFVIQLLDVDSAHAELSTYSASMNISTHPEGEGSSRRGHGFRTNLRSFC